MKRRAGVLCFVAVVTGIAQVGAQQKGAASGPYPYTRKSVADGKKYYLVNCVECHDQDGKGYGRRDFSGTPPADLTDPDLWLHGTAEKAIFTTIKEGTPEDMPPFGDKLTDEQIWNIVNYVRSLGPESKRPKFVEEP